MRFLHQNPSLSSTIGYSASPSGSVGHERQNGINIPISRRGLFANQTEAIVYHRNHSRASGVLVIHSSCPRPYYVVRLSGPTLIGTQSMTHYHPNHSRIERMYYNHTRQVIVDRTDEGGTLTKIRLAPISISGEYWLEVLQFTCNTTRNELPQYCLPNSLDRLTLNEMVQLDLQVSDAHSVPVGHGFWKRRETDQISSKPIRTRFQVDQRCTNSRGNCDRSWVQEYSFVNQSLKWPHRMSTNKTFCLVGDSHMDRMSASIGTLFQEYDPDANNHVRFILQHFPHEWDDFNISNTLLEYNCSLTILSLGIWSLSHRIEHPLDRLDWFTQMEHIINTFPWTENHFLIVLLTHPVALRSYTTTCPPRAWFVPHMIDDYNQHLQMLSELHPAFQEGPNQKAKLLDSYPVLQSVWDSGSDWMHFDEPMQTPETHFILNILSDVISEKKIIQENILAKLHTGEGSASPVLEVQSLNLFLLTGVCIMTVSLLWFMRFAKLNQ